MAQIWWKFIGNIWSFGQKVVYFFSGHAAVPKGHKTPTSAELLCSVVTLHARHLLSFLSARWNKLQTFAVWLNTPPDDTGPHRATPDPTGPHRKGPVGSGGVFSHTQTFAAVLHGPAFRVLHFHPLSWYYIFRSCIFQTCIFSYPAVDRSDSGKNSIRFDSRLRIDFSILLDSTIW